MSYDIFISYRRDGGEMLAQLLYDRLSADGYKVFLDVESLRSGKFNEELYNMIEGCKDFLLILPENGLDRCQSPEDWVRKEIEYALIRRKNIIPVMMRNFTFPSELPATLRELPNYNGVQASMDLFDGVMIKLKKMLVSCSAKNMATRFPVRKDPDFSDEIKEDLVCVALTNKGYLYISPEEAKIPVHNIDEYQSALEKINQIRSGEVAVTPHTLIDQLAIGPDLYSIYDIFLYQGKKYAYCLKNEEKSGLIPEIAFVEFLPDDGFCLLVNELQRVQILTYYIMYKRLFSCIPECLTKGGKLYSDVLMKTANEEIMNGVKNLVGEMSTSASFDEVMTLGNEVYEVRNILAPTLCGMSPKRFFEPRSPLCISHTEKQVYVPDLGSKGDYSGWCNPKYSFMYCGLVNRNCQKTWAGRFLQTESRCSVKTPLDGYGIMDIAKIWGSENSFLVFAYPERNYEYDNLIDKPTIFIVRFDQKYNMTITKLNSSDARKALEGNLLKERFALIAASMKAFCNQVFDSRAGLEWQ